jgi:hypothetical protein
MLLTCPDGSRTMSKDSNLFGLDLVIKFDKVRLS